jgi:hypothetical protein
MTRFRRAAAWAVVALLAACGASSLAAQGVTSAAVQGKVTQAGGQPVEGATVIATNTSTGFRMQVVTRSGGRYTFENLPPGGPYDISARGVGFQPNTRSGVQLTLGQRFTADFELTQAVVQVQELTINAAVDPLINKGRTGAASTISDSTVRALPTLSRNFTDFVVASPQVIAAPGGSPSIAGSNNRFNNIQIDGAVNNDLFGLGSSGVPGGQNENARPIPLDAVKQFQVLVSPFDVRQGGFTGGLINAITQSGTNEWRGDAWIEAQNQGLVGKDSAGKSIADFNTTRFGGSLGGPIVKDKAQFFVSADIQHSLNPYSGQLLSGANGTLAQQFADTLQTLYGIGAGTAGAFNANNPATNIFAKVNAQVSQNSQLELSENYGKTTADNIYAGRSINGNFALTSNMYQITNKTNSLRLKLTSVLGQRYNNELIAGYQSVSDNRPPNSPYATIQLTGTGGVFLLAGAERFSQANTLDQKIFELTDNLSFDLNDKNRLTVGTHNEFFGFTNVFFPQSIGQWNFGTLDSLAQGLPNTYTRALTGAQAGIPGGRTDGPVADFNVHQFGLYVQDQFTPSPKMTIQIGLRADDPTFPTKPAFNQQLSDSMGFNTSVFPSGNILWAPRVGFNYDAKGDGSFIVRGGAGVFSGRPPYVWLSNAFGNTGKEQAQLTCTGAGLPAFNSDTTEYTQCVGGGPLNQPKATINLFDKNFKFPQTFRVTLGADKRLPWGMVGSIDLMYAMNYNTLYLNDANLAGVQGTLAGEGNRPVYGNPTLANPTPIKATGGSNFNQVIVHTNQNKDYAYSGSIQVAKNFSDHVEFTAGYTYSRAYDLISQTSSIAASNLGFATLDGTLADRNVRPSAFDRPNKITISGTYHFPHSIDLSMIYVGISGTPFGYVVSGDANFDGIGSSQQNDMFYVPKDSADMHLVNPAQWDTLNTFINSQSCLSSQRGQVMKRDSCRNPWQNYLNASLAWTLPQIRGQRFTISADVINLLHLISSDWGIIRTTSSFEGTNIVRRAAGAAGYDQANERNIYSLALPTQNLQSVAASRWRVQIGARYDF